MSRGIKIKICMGNITLRKICKFLILTLLVLLQTKFPIKAEKFFNCTQIDSQPNCKCQFRFLKSEITCTQPNSTGSSKALEKRPYVEIFVPTNHRSLELRCKDFSDQITPLLPELSVGDTELVKIFDCPLTENFTITDIFKKLKLKNVLKVQFENKNNEFKSFKLKRDNSKDLEGLIYLSLSLAQSAALTADVFENLNKLKTLELRTQQLELPANLFEALKNLTNLSLAPYNATKLPVDIFRFNQKLSKLSLRESNIAVIPKATIAHLTELKDLHLIANALKTIELNTFDTLINLSSFCLNFNYIEALPEGLFAYTKKLQKFSLAANHVPLSTLPTDLLANLPVLKTIIINCQLEHIEAIIFKNSTKIARIELEGNKLTFLPETLFLDQENLLELDLSDNLLSQLAENLFLNNNKLEILRLSSNQITEINGKTFKPLTSLKTLLMDKNLLTTIDANAFVSLIKLTELNLKNNRIQLIPNSTFQALKSLENLNLSNNSITQMLFIEEFSSLPLKKLQLSDNKIQFVDLSTLIYSQPYVEIDLTNNRLEKINYDANLTLPQPQAKHGLINFAGNPLKCDCALFGFVEFLKRKAALNIISKINYLTCETPMHLKQKTLTQIVPSELYCEMETCLDNCQCFKFPLNQTISIDCSKSTDATASLALLPKVIKNLKTYEIKNFAINLEHNNLMQLPIMSTAEFDEVKVLKLAGNKLNKFNLENLPRNLKQLDLRDNNLTTIDNKMLKHFENTLLNRTLLLSGNPWQCDCALKPLLAYAQRNFETLVDRAEMRCIFADNSTKTFQLLTITDICPTANKLLLLALSILVALIIIFVILCFLYLKFKTEIKIWLYAHKMFLWLITESELDKHKIFDAFISYSSKDEQFVVEHLVPELENGTPPFKLCVHYRNFLVGENIAKNIANAIENSRRTIILLSKNFLESDWALHEFRSAHLAALEEKQPRVIVILYGDIGDKNEIDVELQAYLKTKTYLEWNDPKFWARLRFAMPHNSHFQSDYTDDLTMEPIKNGYAIVNGGYVRA